MFESYLLDIHAKNYHGTDDDMTDAFEAWVCNLDVQEIIDYGNKAMEEFYNLIGTHTEHEGSYCDTGADMEWSCRSECVSLAQDRIKKRFN